MAGRRHRSYVSRLRSRRLIGAIAVPLVAAALVTIPAEPAAHAALNNLTNFEIDANQVVNGPSPPSGGAGIDWDNAASFLQDVGKPTEPCTGTDPSVVTGKLNAFDPFAPNPHAGSVNGKDDLCQAFTAWQPVNVTVGAVTSVHYILYGGWRRNAVPGDMSFFIPLIGGATKSAVTLVQFDFNPAGGGSTAVSLQQWNGTSWVTKPGVPASAFQGIAEPGNSPAFGEFAVDLTAAGVLPVDQTCVSLVSSYVITRPGNGNADLEDYLAVPPVQISNCSTVQITKTTTPAVSGAPANFTYTLDRTDGGPVQDTSPLTPPNTDANPSSAVIAGTLTVPTAPTDVFTNIFAAGSYRLLENLPPPAPWSHQSVVCNYFNPAVLDANNKATPATATLTNPDGSWTGQTFTVAPTGLLPAGVTVAATCTISNRAPSLTLAKQVVNTVGNAAATADMWSLSATPTAGTAIDFGPGTESGVTKVVGPNTYTLAETPNPANPPPLGYTAGPWSCVDAVGNTVPVTGSQVVIGATANVTCTITNTADDFARLTLHKVVVGGTATVGQFTLTASQGGSSGSIDGTPISGIDGSASVTSRAVKRGSFALGETGPSGYVPSWVCTNGAGLVVSRTNGVEIPAAFTNPNELVVSCTVTNTSTELDIDVSGAAVNPAGRPHTFTLTAHRVDTGAPLTGALLNLSFSNSALVTGNTCQTAPGTDSNGQCTITVNSNIPGAFVLTVNGFTNQGPNGPLPGAAFTLPAPVSTTKLWTTYRVEGESAINLVGDTEHTFTLRGFQNDGTSESPLPSGSVIAYTWSGAGPVSPASQCTVDASGTCDVTVSAATTGPESGTLTVTSVTVSLPDGLGGSTSYTLSTGDVALSAPLPVLTKSWVGFRVRVVPSAQVNLVGQPHTFTVTAEFATAPGAWQPVNGGTVALAWASSVANPDPSSTCPVLSAAGTCTFTVVPTTPLEPGVGVLSVTGLTAPGVTIGGQTTIITEPIGAAALDLSAATAEKTWVLVDVTISPGVDNLAGESHSFTVQVTGFDGDGPFPDGTGVPGAVVTSSVVSTVGGAAVTGNTCLTGTNANGQCTITVSNTGSGSIVLQLEQVSVTIDGTDFVIDLTPGARGLRSDAILPIRTDKVWWQYRVILSDSAINPLGVSHTFTATVQRTNDGAVTWLPVPPGALLSYNWSDPFSVSSVDTANSTCITTGTIANGTCSFVVTSTAATIGTLTIQGIASTWLDRNRDGLTGAPTDPVPDPVEFAAEIVSIPRSQLNATSVLSASKTWWNFTVDVSGPAENPVGTDHTFTLTVRFSDGFGFQPVAPGTTMTYAWSGPAGSAEDPTRSTCDPANGPGTNISGQCTVVIASPTGPGTGTLTITGIASTEIPQPPRTVSFTFPTPGTTTKTWIAYRALISPSSTNLAGTPHTFTVTVQQDRGDGNGFVAVPDGTTIAVALTDPTKLTGSTCTGGTVGGTCTITVASDSPGAVTVQPGAITVSLLDGTGARVPVAVPPGSPAYATPGSATKTWVAVGVSVTPAAATNLVGQSHTFTVHVDVVGADGTTTPRPAPDGATVAWTFSGPGTLSAGATTCDTLGTVGGTCDIEFTNNGTPGSGTLTITSVTFTANGQTFTVDLAAGGPAQATPPPITAAKTWGAYAVTITPSANNPVGTQHNFTITANVDNGTTTVPAAGATIAFTWTGAGTLLTPSPCTTSAAGTCIVSVSSPAAGTGTLTVTTLTDSAGAVVDLTTPGAPGQAAGQVVPLVASKTWLQYRVLFDTPTATNLVGEPHTFTATVQQSALPNPTEADWTAVANGTTLTASTSGTGSVDPTSTCMTGGTTGGTCSFVVHDDGPGILDLTVTAINATTVDGAAFTNIALTAPATASKTWVSAAVSVTPPAATNLVGQTHTFTVHVDLIGADGTTTPQPAPDGSTVTWTFNGPGTLAAGATTCNAVGTVAGTCDIEFTNDGTPGSGTLTITSVTFTANGQTFTVDLTTTGPGQASQLPITATKTWGAYAVTITPSAHNPVGTQHDFTITANVDDGTTTVPAAGATIAFTWTGAGTLLTPSPCTTGAAGTCIVSVSSPLAGTGALTVTTLTDSAGAVVDLTTPGAPGQAAGQVVPLTATKTWLQYRVLLDTAATNLVGVPHTFTATVQYSPVADPTPADWLPVSDLTTLTVSTAGEGTLDPTSTCLTGGTSIGTCTLVVHDAGPGTLDLTVTAIAATTVDAVSFTNIALTTPATTSKTWVSVAVSVTPPTATNLVGQSHTFNVHVDVIGADGTPTPQPAPDGATVTWTFDGPGLVANGATTCPNVGTVGGTCDIVFTNSGTPGSGTLTITSVTFTANGQSFTVDLTAGGPAQATPPPITATKTWGAYVVTVTPSANNPVGTQHDFVITANVDDGTATTPAAGATITFNWTGAGTLLTPSPCTTAANGTCIVSVTSATAGTGTLTVTSLTDSSGAVVDLMIPGAPGQSAGQVVPVTATKTWLQYRVLLAVPTATNLVGVPHTFTATVQQSALPNPTDGDWTGVADGTTLTASTSGPGSLDPASTCLTGGTTGGTCSFVVRDGGPGTLDLTVTAVAATTIGGATFTDIALNAPVDASKTWVSAAVSVTPATATNIVDQSHTFTVHVDVIGADGTTTPRPAPDGTTVTWTFDGAGTLDTGATTCNTGTAAGTCTITLTNNGTAGAGTLTITSVTFTVNGQPLTVDLTAAGPGQATPPPITATKTWADYRVTVTPPAAINLVGQPHTFTVLVEHDTGTGFEPLAGADVALSTSGTAVPDEPVPSSCVTESAGTCTITITSSVPGTLTLTATYEAASDAGAMSFSGSGNKAWVPGWSLRIVKASSVSSSDQLFAFQADGPPPIGTQSFSLAIGQTQLFERLAAGTYTVAELTDAAHLPPPWRLQSLACTGLSDDATAVIDGALATLTLPPPNPGGAITCTYTNERMNLFVHKTDGGVTAVAGGDPFDYTITVGNNGSVATSAPITVTDTLGAGLVFAGAARPPAGGSCAPPVGQVLTCTLTAPIPPGGTVQIVVPARALTSAAPTVVNNVKIDSDEDTLCPHGTCPPPPTCPAPAQTVALTAARSGGDPSDNQACVHTAVEPAGSSIGPESGGEQPTVPPAESSSGSSTGNLPFTGSTTFPLAIGTVCLLVGLGISMFVRRRRAHRSA